MMRFAGGVFVRPQVSPARIPGFRWWPEERAREAVGPEERKYVRAAPDQHAGNADGLPLCGMRRAAAESHRPGREMPEVRVRSARLQTVRTLCPGKPLRMQSAHSCQNLSQRQAQRLLAVFHTRNG